MKYMLILASFCGWLYSDVGNATEFTPDEQKQIADQIAEQNSPEIEHSVLTDADEENYTMYHDEDQDTETVEPEVKAH